MEYKDIHLLLTELGFTDSKYEGHGNRIIWSKFIRNGDLILHWYSGDGKWNLEFRELYHDGSWSSDWTLLCEGVNLEKFEQFLIAFENLK